MAITNNETNELIRQKHELLRQFDRKELDEETYNKRLEAIENRIEERTRIHLEQQQKADEERLAKQEEKQEEDIMSEEEKKAIGRKPKEDSYTMLIVKALSTKTLKDIGSVVAKVDEWKPGRDKDKIEKQVKSIIYLVKKQKGARWEKYSWDDANFLLTEKQ